MQPYSWNILKQSIEEITKLHLPIIITCWHYWFSSGSDKQKCEQKGMYGSEQKVNQFIKKQKTRVLYRISIIPTTMGRIMDV